MESDVDLDGGESSARTGEIDGAFGERSREDSSPRASQPERLQNVSKTGEESRGLRRTGEDTKRW